MRMLQVVNNNQSKFNVILRILLFICYSKMHFLYYNSKQKTQKILLFTLLTWLDVFWGKIIQLVFVLYATKTLACMGNGWHCYMSNLRALWNVAPTLRQCGFCHEAQETTKHVLWSYPFTQLVWNKVMSLFLTINVGCLFSWGCYIPG